MDLINEIDKRAKVLTEDNFQAIRRSFVSGDDYSYDVLLTLLTSAMTIGASIVVERGGPDPVPGENTIDLSGIADQLFSSERELADEDRWRHEEHQRRVQADMERYPS